MKHILPPETEWDVVTRDDFDPVLRRNGRLAVIAFCVLSWVAIAAFALTHLREAGL